MPRDEVFGRTAVVTRVRPSSQAAHQAFRLLHVLFVVVPTVAGLDKFFHVLTNWNMYLAPQIAGLLPFSEGTFMRVAGVVEIAAGLLVAIKPRIGGVVVGLWLLGIIVNLLLLRDYYDVAFRDLGLAVAAFSMALLAKRAPADAIS
jgi:hypothetical protein